MAFYNIIIGSGLLNKKQQISPFGKTPVEFRDNGEMFYKFLHESSDLFAIIWSPRVKKLWEEYLARFPDLLDKFLLYEMPYAVSCALHLHDHEQAHRIGTEAHDLGLTDSRRTKLIILKGGKYEGNNQARV